MQIGDYSVVDMQTVRDPNDKELVSVIMKNMALKDLPEDAKGKAKSLIVLDGEYTLDGHEGGEGEMGMKMSVKTLFDPEKGKEEGDDEVEAEEVGEEGGEEAKTKTKTKPAEKRKKMVVRIGKSYASKAKGVQEEEKEEKEEEGKGAGDHNTPDDTPGEEEAKEILDHILDFAGNVASWFKGKQKEK